MDAPIPYVCPADGHLHNRRVIAGKVRPEDAICPRHGVKLFRDCPTCGIRWPLISAGSYSTTPNMGASFCTNAKCGAPAPWLKRRDIIEWIQHKIQVAADIPPATRLELREVLEHLQAMNPDDTKAIAGWRKIRDAAPKVWEATKPVRDVLISEAMRKLLAE